MALPLAFLGMHQAPGPDEDKGESHDATLWSEVWQENVPGEENPDSINENYALLINLLQYTEHIKETKQIFLFYKVLFYQLILSASDVLYICDDIKI